MPIFRVLLRRARTAWRRHVLRDPLILEADRWRRDRGDETLRLDYPLDASSVVLDLGGYRGDFAAALHARYGCRVILFEPVRQFHDHCHRRFKAVEAITCLNYGLAGAEAEVDIGVDEDASSVVRHAGQPVQRIRLRAVTEVLREQRLGTIDLMKINIEGGEFDLLSSLIASGAIADIVDLHIQFHDFVPNARSRRDALRTALACTHEQTWNYPFVWENWRRKPLPADARRSP